MEGARLGTAEIVAAVGAIALLVGLFALPWYGVGEGKIAPLQIQSPVAPGLYAQVDIPEQPGLPGGVDPSELPDRTVPDDFGAWTAQGALGTVGNVVLLLAALGALAVAGLRATGTGAPGRSSMLVAALGVAAVVVVVLRLVFRPEDVDGYEFQATLKAGAFVTLLGAALVAGAGALGLGRDREPPRTP